MSEVITKVHARRLRILADHMERVKRVEDMSRYFKQPFAVSCGTPSCVLGEASTIPALRRAGLRTYQSFGEWIVEGTGEAFGIGVATDLWDRLFGPYRNNAYLVRSPSGTRVAREIRKVLVEHGHPAKL